MTVAVVGAGFSGAVVARELADRGFKVSVFEKRGHVAGNCHTERDASTGIMLHVYGPHIFHTDNKRVWDYINRYDKILPFVNRVKTVVEGRVYPMPINLLTLNTFFKRCMSPHEAQIFINGLADQSIGEPHSFEEQALKFLGPEIYKTFFRGYTIKQWGLDPTLLPASILKRLPVRFNYDDNYYSSKYQGIPSRGYTYIVRQILAHPNIEVELDTQFDKEKRGEFKHVFYSGPIDSWYGFSHGKLRYRTLDFRLERHSGDFQGNAVMNYGDISVPWTRISEHKHFTPWETFDDTVIYREFSRDCETGDTPYYPVRLLEDKGLLRSYIDMANSERGVTFIGRLGTYRYLDMHVTIQEAFDAAERFVSCEASGATMPAFCVDPL